MIPKVADFSDKIMRKFLLQPLQGAARGLIPIDCAAIWYQLVDLKTVTRLTALRLLRLAFAFTCDPWRAE
jgi:hypothetical protein